MRAAKTAPILAAVATLAWPSAASPQEAASRNAHGWIGISFTYRTPAEETGRMEAPGAVVVSGIFQGSPADRAGVQPGDTILRVNGRPAELEAFKEFGSRLRAGDAVRFTLRKDGRVREVEVEAGRRPAVIHRPLSPEVVAHLDSLRQALVARMDSLQIRLRVDARNGRARLHLPGDSSHVLTVSPSPVPEPRGRDAPRSLSPLLVGRDYVAGAHVTPMKPGLSDYFGVDRGLLVTDVVEESPADEAGIRAGDVILSVEGIPCGTVGELRAVLMKAGGTPTSVELVRKGETTWVRMPD